jgi:transposase
MKKEKKMRGRPSKKMYSASEKAAIALEALKGDKTFNELTQKYGVHPTQINRWKNKLKAGMVEIFSSKKEKDNIENDQLVEELYRKIGQLEVERDWLKKKSELFG